MRIPAQSCLFAMTKYVDIRPKTIYNYRELNFNQGYILVDVEIFNETNHSTTISFSLSRFSFAAVFQKKDTLQLLFGTACKFVRYTNFISLI
jgi:hypothetical protein